MAQPVLKKKMCFQLSLFQFLYNVLSTINLYMEMGETFLISHRLPAFGSLIVSNYEKVLCSFHIYMSCLLTKEQEIYEFKNFLFDLKQPIACPARTFVISQRCLVTS